MTDPNVYSSTMKGLRIPTGDGTSWIGGIVPVGNSSAGYHGLLFAWMELYNVHGDGFIIGEEGESGINVKNLINNLFPDKMKHLLTASLTGADITWDIVKPFPYKWKVDWILCQAVLEHVIDPVAAMKNMSNTLNVGGYLLIHTHGPDMAMHRYPIDCYRFLPDALPAMAGLAKLSIVDAYWNPIHTLAIYKKENEIVSGEGND